MHHTTNLGSKFHLISDTMRINYLIQIKGWVFPTDSELPRLKTKELNLDLEILFLKASRNQWSLNEQHFEINMCLSFSNNKKKSNIFDALRHRGAIFQATQDNCATSRSAFCSSKSRCFDVIKYQNTSSTILLWVFYVILWTSPTFLFNLIFVTNPKNVKVTLYSKLVRYCRL